jgi:glycosyltransferase involved in cell wall biosynthesis
MHVAVAVPRYGPDILGGAETLVRGFAEETARRGWTVEVWTSCARSHYTWENVYPEGRETVNGVVVHRFPITDRAPDRQAQIESSLSALGVLSPADQYAWLETGAHSAPLYRHIALHANRPDALIVLPYAAPLAHYAAWAAPGRVVVWPCLHDEPYAYMEPVRLLLESAWGVMFNSPEEQELATRILGTRISRCAVLGAGVHLASSEPGLAGSHLLYVGRLEEGKNLALLYAYVRRYVDDGGDLRLIVLGGGPFKPPDHPAFEYRGFVSEEEKATACATALALCQPSQNESFSLTMMESWLAGRPVLVHGDCAVTRGHVQRSKGGLWFRSYAEFAGCIEWFRTHPDLATRMGRNGSEYVHRNYTWQAIADRFQRTVTAWQDVDRGREE